MTALAWLWSCAAPRAVAPADSPLRDPWFRGGGEGWEADGDAFRRFVDPRLGRASITTHGAAGDAGRGSLRQSFVVPADAVALRFAVHGGHARVRLREGDRVVAEVSGPDDNTLRVPVWWPLLAERGRELELSIEDDDAGQWGFVSVSGFDLVRDRPPVLVNGDFADGLRGWQGEGDSGLFRAFRRGQRGALTTAGAADPDGPTGRVSQTFTVPDDAEGLWFEVHGGRSGTVTLATVDGAPLREATGADRIRPGTAVWWDLQPLRGQRVVLAIVDAATAPPFGFLGVSGLDVVRTGGSLGP